MFRRCLCKWFGLLDPRDLPVPAEARQIEPMTAIDRTAMVASAYDHPGTRYLLDVAHNRRIPFEREQLQLINNISSQADADALMRRLCYLDGALAENRWFERQLDIARNQAGQSSSASTAVE